MTTPPPQASPSRQSNIPANSRRSGPRVSLAAWSPNNLTQRRHGGSPLEHRTTAAGRHPPHLLGPNLNHRVPTPIIPRLASITTPLRWIRANIGQWRRPEQTSICSASALKCLNLPQVPGPMVTSMTVILRPRPLWNPHRSRRQRPNQLCDPAPGPNAHTL